MDSKTQLKVDIIAKLTDSLLDPIAIRLPAPPKNSRRRVAELCDVFSSSFFCLTQHHCCQQVIYLSTALDKTILKLNRDCGIPVITKGGIPQIE